MLKNDRTFQWVAQCLSAEIDASRFAGTEQIFAGAPHIFSLGAKLDFQHDRCRRLDRSRCSKTIEKHIGFAQCLPAEIDASRILGTEQSFADALHVFSLGAKIDFPTPLTQVTQKRTWLLKMDSGAA